MNRILIVLAVTIVAFVFHSALRLEAATIAMLGATVVHAARPPGPARGPERDRVEHAVFFVGLFIMVEAIVQVGIVGGIADAVVRNADQQHLDGRHAGDPVVLRGGLGDRGQHPVHRHGDPGDPTAGGERAPRRARVVGPVAGRLPGRQPDDRRGVGEHRGREHGCTGGPHDPRSCNSCAMGWAWSRLPWRSRRCTSTCATWASPGSHVARWRPARGAGPWRRPVAPARGAGPWRRPVAPALLRRPVAPARRRGP